MLGDVLPAEAFAFLLVFTRLAAIVAVVPALGETSIPGRVRLATALLISLILFVAVGDSLPDMPTSPLALTGLLAREFLIGIMIGGAARLIMTSLHVAGTVMAFQSGLAAAQSFDPAQGTQSVLLSSFMTFMGVTLIFVTDLHHMVLGAMQASYGYFPAGGPIVFTDFALLVTDTVARSFALGMQLAAPMIVYGLIFNIGLGLTARLMPQLPIFFIATPLNLMLGFVILLFTMSSLMMWFLTHFEDQLATFLG